MTSPNRTKNAPIGRKNGHGLGAGRCTACGAALGALASPLPVAVTAGRRRGTTQVPLGSDATAIAGDASWPGTCEPSPGAPWDDWASTRCQSSMASRIHPARTASVTTSPTRKTGTSTCWPAGWMTSANSAMASPMGRKNGHGLGPGMWTPGGGAAEVSGRGTRERFMSAIDRQRSAVMASTRTTTPLKISGSQRIGSPQSGETNLSSVERSAVQAFEIGAGIAPPTRRPGRSRCR